MSEAGAGELELKKLEVPKYSQKIAITGSKEATDQGADIKEFVSAVVVRENGEQGDREMKLVKKKLDRFIMQFWMINENNPPATDYYLKWKILKRAGLPTVPSMRVVSDDEVLMTDMTADGSELFGKSQVTSGIKVENKLVKEFVEISKDDLLHEMERLAQIASKNKILLPGDDPFELLVHPDGKWEFVVLDLSQMEIVDEEYKAASSNNSNVEWMLECLSEIRDKINR